MQMNAPVIHVRMAGLVTIHPAYIYAPVLQNTLELIVKHKQVSRVYSVSFKSIENLLDNN